MKPSVPTGINGVHLDDVYMSDMSFNVFVSQIMVNCFSLIATPCSNSDSCTASDDYWLLRPDDGSEDNNMYAELVRCRDNGVLCRMALLIG